jgi:RNA polymerase sigma factor (TIGR02999 family)
MSETAAVSKNSELLQAVERGDAAALTALFSLAYDELSILAHHQRRRWHGNITLDTTALVHEVYLKLAGQERPASKSRAQFFAVAAKAMRHILCNYARDRNRKKRGGGVEHVRLELGEELAGQLQLSDDQTERLTALDEALRALQRIGERQTRVVECRFFGGMSLEDTATALGISPRTVQRDWIFARAWLRREMQLKLDEVG